MVFHLGLEGVVLGGCVLFIFALQNAAEHGIGNQSLGDSRTTAVAHLAGPAHIGLVNAVNGGIVRTEGVQKMYTKSLDVRVKRVEDVERAEFGRQMRALGAHVGESDKEVAGQLPLNGQVP